jgi:hypothetical protein
MTPMTEATPLCGDATDTGASALRETARLTGPRPEGGMGR